MPFGSGSHRAAARVVSRHEIRDVLAEYARLTGCKVGSPGWDEAIHPDDRARVRDEWESAQRRGRFCCEYRLRFRDGLYRYVRGWSVRVRSILRVKWRGYIKPIDRDHHHVCEGKRCYCPASM